MQNSTSSLLYLPNGGRILDIEKMEPHLRNIDIGRGTLFLSFINSSLDFSQFDCSVRTVLQTPLERKYRLQFNKLLSQLKYPLTSSDKMYLLSTLGSLKGKHDFLEIGITTNERLGCFIHSGCKFLSDKVIYANREIYDSTKDFIHDLSLIHQLSIKSRTVFAKRLLQAYYSTPQFDECCWSVRNHPYNHIDLRLKRIYLKTAPVKIGNYFLFLAGIEQGAYIIQNDGRYEREGVVPLGLNRIKRVYNNSMVSSLKEIRKRLDSINCLKNVERAAYLREVYQPIEEVLPELKTVSRRVFHPVYNFRPCDNALKPWGIQKTASQRL